jgi:hypothetical protein
MLRPVSMTHREHPMPIPIPLSGACLPAPAAVEAAQVQALAARLADGDLVFIRIPIQPFLKVAAATGSWTNHVGIVVDTGGREPRIAESRFPFSRTTTLSRFVARSDRGRVAVARLDARLTPDQRERLSAAARRRLGVFYDTGFDLHSGRQFCSRYVREVLAEATGVEVGEVETFATLLARQPGTGLRFWKFWYFGRIPWQRETVTPASLLHSPAVRTVFDGVATRRPPRARLKTTRSRVADCVR